MIESSFRRVVAMLVCMALSLVCDAQAWQLVVGHGDGTSTVIRLHTQPRISVLADTIVISSSVASMKWKATDVVRLTYQATNTGVRSPKKEGAMYFGDGKLVFPNVKDADGIAVYDMKGVAVHATVVAGENGVGIELSSLRPGVYLVSVMGKTFKFVKP